MINSLALSLVFTSLLAAQVWSPNPQQNHNKEDVIVKQGRRVIVVESYDQNGQHNTKVSISPPQDPISSVNGKFPSGLVDDAKDKIKQGVSTVFSSKPKFVDSGKGHSTGELIRDALDKSHCKNTMSDALHKAKDQASEKASEKVHGAKEAVENTLGKLETAHGAKEVVENAYGEAREKASEKVHGAKEVVEHAYGKATEEASEKVHSAKEVVEDAYGKVTEKASEKVHGGKEVVEDAYGKATEKASDTAHGAKELLGNSYRKATDVKASHTAHRAKEAVEDAYEKTKDYAAHKAHDVKETTSESLKQVKETAKTTKDVGKTIRTDTARNVPEQVGILKNNTRQAASSIFKALKDGIRYVTSGQWLDPLFGVINLLGFSIAYGMGMWVTFVSSHVLASSLPRHQFGLVQSKIYPLYFRAMGLSIIMALLGHIGGRRRLISSSKAERLQVYNLLASLLAVSVNGFYLEPLATKAMFEKFKLEKEEGRGREMQAPESSRAEAAAGIAETSTTEGAAAITEGAATAEAEQQEQRGIREKMTRMNERLKRLNSYSAFLNILTLMALSWHLADLGHCVHGTC